MEWQITRVSGALANLLLEPCLPVHGVLCFVGSEWPLFFDKEGIDGAKHCSPLVGSPSGPPVPRRQLAVSLAIWNA